MIQNTNRFSNVLINTNISGNVLAELKQNNTTIQGSPNKRILQSKLKKIIKKMLNRKYKLKKSETAFLHEMGKTALQFFSERTQKHPNKMNTTQNGEVAHKNTNIPNSKKVTE